MRKFEQLPEWEAQLIADELREMSDLNRAVEVADALTRGHPVLTIEISPNLPLFRVRPTSTDAGFRSPQDMLEPPAQNVRAGRLNDAGQPILYLSRQLTTALAEVGAREGQMFHCIAIRPIRKFSLRLTLIGEHHHVLRTGHLASIGEDPDSVIQKNLMKLGEPAITRIAFADSLMAEILSDPKARSLDYIPQRALFQSLRRGSPSARGMLYPSARQQYGWNFAIDPPTLDRDIKIVASSVVRIGHVLSNGYFDIETIRHHMLRPESTTFETIHGAPKKGLAFFNVTDEEVARFVHSHDGSD